MLQRSGERKTDVGLFTKGFGLVQRKDAAYTPAPKKGKSPFLERAPHHSAVGLCPRLRALPAGTGHRPSGGLERSYAPGPNFSRAAEEPTCYSFCGAGRD